MVDSGDITPVEADQKTEEWESQEWQLRMNALPKKIGHALIRFHSCTALMRFYELIMARYVLRVDGDVGRDLFVPGAATSKGNSSNFSQERAIDIMDKLTRDPFQAALRTSQILHNQEHANGKVISSTNGTETTTSREIATRMFSTCIWANIIPFLAELTVQQGVLMYGYGAYYMAKHKRRKKHEAIEAGESKCDELDKHEEAAYALSLFFRSCHLTVARSASWLVASAGGAAGSVILPGWVSLTAITFCAASLPCLPSLIFFYRARSLAFKLEMLLQGHCLIEIAVLVNFLIWFSEISQSTSKSNDCN
jgi:hypothetical protein